MKPDNPAAAMAKLRWAKTTKAERQEHAARAGQARWAGMTAEEKRAATEKMRAAKKKGKGKEKKKGDVRLFGILVRDVAPMVIELMSLYLPLGTVGGLGARAVAARNGGGS